MGQQQLLLLVLGIVIVGLAVVVGIQAFSENQKKANADALVMTSMRIASDAQAWLRKPQPFGGPAPDATTGGRPSDFTGTGLTLTTLGYPVDATTSNYSDINGEYAATISSGAFVISASSATTSGSGDNNLVCVTVAGLTTDDITTTINAGTSC